MVTGFRSTGEKQIKIIPRQTGWIWKRIVFDVKTGELNAKDFLMNEMHHDDEMDSYNMQQPQFIPAGFKNHLKQLMPERIEKTEAGYFATTETGRRLSKKPKSKKAALMQLAAVEISKT